MPFKYPFLLLALIALAIPIIIHFFKLRKFQKTDFSNVFFLEKINIESRKSAQLKKWWVLLSRLGIFVGLIVAFAYPYFPATNNSTLPNHYVIYLDNSFSMQAKSEKGQLLQVGIQDILSSIPPNIEFSLFTNNEVYPDITLTDYRNEIITINYTAEQLTADQIILQYNSLKKKEKQNRLFAISDFQIKNTKNNDGFKKISKIAKNSIQLTPQSTENISVDSVWVSNKNQKTVLRVSSSSNVATKSTLSVLNGSKLIGKASLDFSESNTIVSDFSIQENSTVIGTASVNDPDGLQFDNKSYFSVNNIKKPKIIILGDVFTDFLQKIYPKEEFQLTTYKTNTSNIPDIEDADLIILNELEQWGSKNFNQLKSYYNSGGKICIIPNTKQPDFTSNFLKEYFDIKLGKLSKERKKLTQINYQHPIFENVFTKQITNFQYPTVNKSYFINSKNWILNLEDQNPFLVHQNNIYLFTSGLSKIDTNFKNSPIIVPVFYNMLKEKNTTSSLAYYIGANNEINVWTNTSAEEILEISSNQTTYLPLQRQYKNYVKLTTQTEPAVAGNYSITKGKEKLQSISYNYPRDENNDRYYEFEDRSKISTSLKSAIEKSNLQESNTDLWKWFITFALIFLLIEIILLKFLK